MSVTRAENRAPDPDSLPAHLRARRDRIVTAAIDLLEHGEYDEIQIRDVARQAGVALGTLYRYFTSKEHLYAAALIEWSRSFELKNLARRPGGESDEDRLRQMVGRAVRAFERRPQMLRAEIAIETSNDPNARALFEEFAARHIEVMTGTLRDATPEDAAAVVATTNNVMASQLRAWALGRISISDVHAALDRTVDLIFAPAPGSTTSTSDPLVPQRDDTDGAS